MLMLASAGYIPQVAQRELSLYHITDSQAELDLNLIY